MPFGGPIDFSQILDLAEVHILNWNITHKKICFFSVCENAAGSRVNAKSYMAPINLLHYKTTKHLHNLTFSGCFCHFLKTKINVCYTSTTVCVHNVSHDKHAYIFFYQWCVICLCVNWPYNVSQKTLVRFHYPEFCCRHIIRGGLQQWITLKWLINVHSSTFQCFVQVIILLSYYGKVSLHCSVIAANERHLV